MTLPNFEHFQAKKQIQFSFQLFHSRSPWLSNNKYYFRYGSYFCNFIRKLFSDNSQIIDVIDNQIGALISRIDYTGLHFQNFFKSQVEKFIILIAFFPAEYEYANHFFPARPDFPKFYVKVLKITLKSFFYLVLML